MGALGDLTPADATDLVELFTFGWFGVDIRVNPDYQELAFLDFWERGAQLDENDPQVITLVKSLMRELVHPDDFDVFWEKARRARLTQKQLVEAHMAVLSKVADRPTGRPSDSSAGPGTTTRSSGPGSSSPVTVPGPEVSAQEAAARRAMAELEARGRPDLALVVDRAREPRTA